MKIEELHLEQYTYEELNQLYKHIGKLKDKLYRKIALEKYRKTPQYRERKKMQNKRYREKHKEIIKTQQKIYREKRKARTEKDILLGGLLKGE